MNTFPSSILKSLKYYVYLYIDPENEEIFYVGKGNENRCFSHLEDTSESSKVQRINKIRSKGNEPTIEILIHGVDEPTALRVEASVIDLIDISKLTNKVKGHKSSEIGRMSLEKVVSIYKREKAKIVEPSILFKITQEFNYSLKPNELYDATRQFWRLDKDKRDKAKLAFAVFDGVIQEVYEIISWHKAGTTFSNRSPEGVEKDKVEFVGNVAKEGIRKKYLYKDVSDICKYQSAIYYQKI